MQLAVQLQCLVKQLCTVLAQLTDQQFGQKLPVLHGSSIGQHVRHVIELYSELENGYKTGQVNYDNRKRDTELETRRLTALAYLEQMPARVCLENKPLQLKTSYAADGSAMVLDSNYFRELAYNIEHLVHHMALIRTGLTSLPEVQLPEGFGVAASTQRFQAACAQ